jgi:MYXO-CTERM domain-containing protein
MNSFRAVILAIFLAPSAATAGPIAWWYTSTSTGWYTDPNAKEYNSNNFPVDGTGYGIDPAAGTFLTELGGIQNIPLANRVYSPSQVSPIPLRGPTLWTRVEMMHISSGEAYSFRVPIEFYDNEPAPWGEMDMHIARVGKVSPFQVVLGRNKFHVSQGPELTLNMRVTDAPEPTTLLMGVAGLAGIGLMRRRFG